MSQQLLQDASRAGVFHLPAGRREEVKMAARAAGLDVRQVDAQPGVELDGLLRDFGPALAFPDWYGANLDALHDCLTDPEWQGSPGALFISGLDQLYARDPEAFLALVDVFRSAADIRRDQGIPLWVLMDTCAPELPDLPGQ